MPGASPPAPPSSPIAGSPAPGVPPGAPAPGAAGAPPGQKPAWGSIPQPSQQDFQPIGKPEMMREESDLAAPDEFGGPPPNPSEVMRSQIGRAMRRHGVPPRRRTFGFDESPDSPTAA